MKFRGLFQVFLLTASISTLLCTQAIASEFQAAVSLSAGVSPRGIAVGDVYGMGIQNLVVADFGSSTFIGQSTPSSILGLGNYGLQIFSPSPQGLILKDTIPTAASPRGLFVFDFEGKGRSSIFETSYDANLLQVFNFSNGQFKKSDEAPTLGMPVGVAAGTIRPGGTVFAVTADYGANSISLFPFKNGLFGKRVDVPVDLGPTQVALGDLKGDGTNEIAVVCLVAHKIDILSSGNSGRNEDLTNYSVSQTIAINDGGSPSDIQIKDLNKDGLADIVVSDFSNNAIRIYLQQGNGLFLAQPPLLTSGSHPNGLTVGDLFGSGENEVIVANRDSDSIDVFRLVDGAFQLTQTLKTSEESNAQLGPVEVAALDTTGTGTKDLVVSHMRSNSLRVLAQKPTSLPSPTPTTPPLAGTRNGFSAQSTFCFPNPSKDGRVTFSFLLDAPAQVFIQVFDVEGERVWSETISESQTHGGTNEVFWPGINQTGESLASGLYLYTLTVGNQTVQKQLTLVH